MLSFVQVVDEHASKSLRLLAIASGSLLDVAKLDLASMPLQALERRAGHMDLLGLVVMTNHLRADSKDTISHLQDRYDSASTCGLTRSEYRSTALLYSIGASSDCCCALCAPF